MNYEYEIGQTIKASYGREGIISAQTIQESGNLKYQEPAYCVKNGRKSFVVAESDIIKGN